MEVCIAIWCHWPQRPLYLDPKMHPEFIRRDRGGFWFGQVNLRCPWAYPGENECFCRRSLQIRQNGTGSPCRYNHTLSSRQSGRRLNDRSHARRQLYFRPNYNDKSRLPAAQLAKKIWTLKRLRYRHVSGWNPVLAETDCHDEPNSPLDVPHGESLHLELELLGWSWIVQRECFTGSDVFASRVLWAYGSWGHWSGKTSRPGAH